ncbi:MAG: class I SAM-dependent methyltransferase [Acidobacteriota bacterium]
MTLREAWTTRVTAEDYEEHMARIGQAEANAGLLGDLLGVTPGQRVLIAGAGTGQMFGYLPSDFLAGCGVLCSDVNPAFLEKLRGRFVCETVVDDIEDSRLEPGFDTIAVVLVLEHVDWRRAVQSLVRLQPRQLVLIVQKNPAHVTAAVTPGRLPPGTMRVFAEQTPPHLVPVDELLATLSALGFAVERQEARAVQDGKSMVGLLLRPA